MKYFFLLFYLMGSHLSFGSSLCSNPGKVPSYTQMKLDLDKRMAIFANHKVIASQADALLSKLIAAKSPVISEWLKKRDLNTETEDQVVRAWRLYYAQNFILSKYPQDDSKVNTEIENLVDKTLSTHLTLIFKNRLNTLFKKAQEAAIKTVSSYEIEPGSNIIIERIKAVKLYWPKDLKTARNNKLPLDIIAWGIAYDPVPNEINIGLEALSYPNDETYLAVFAHEIGHSFDSCRWGAFFDGKWPFEKVGECLRSSRSVNAKKRDDSKIDELLKSGKLSKDIADGLKLNPTCNKLIYPPIGIQADQLPESFADWFSAEVVANINGIDLTRLRSDLCEQKELSPGSSYPSNEMRLERIYFSQPLLRAKSKNKMSPSGQYCSMK